MKILSSPKTLVLADQAVFSGTGFLLTMLLARHLKVSDFGAYSAIVLVVYLAVSAISAWTSQVFQVAADRTKSYISFVFWIQIVLVLLVVLALKIIQYVFSFQMLSFAWLFGMGFVFYDFGRKILLTLDRPFDVLVLNIFTSSLMIFAFLVFKYQGSKNTNDVLLYFSGVYLLSFLYILYLVRPFEFHLKIFKSYLSKHVNHGKWLFATAVSQWWASNLFVVASGFYLGTAALGALRLGQSIFGVLNVLLQSFENYILPQTVLKMQYNQLSGIHYLRGMNQKLAFVFIPVLFLIFTFSSFLILLAGGENYIKYSFVLKGLSILYIFIFLSQPVRFMIRSLQMNNHFFYAYFLSLVFALLTSGWLISGFGLNGVIAGLIGSQLVLMFYLSLILKLKNINLWKSSTSY